MVSADHPPCEVKSYSIGVLKQVFESQPRTSDEVVAAKTHLKFFEDYFGHKSIKAATVVIENDYVDHDYLEDFAAYYVRCFQAYERKCTRLHFFRREFSKADFDLLIEGDETKLKSSDLAESYIGFIVVKPLPHCFVGRTCLRTYDDEPNRRNFLSLRECEANLFGIKLKVLSLAFQEQDKVVSACATSSLWSAFHSTAVGFQHAFPSPVEITRHATLNMPVRSRVLPNTDGLQGDQMAQAIRAVGLEPLFVDTSKGEEFKGGRLVRAVVYSYLGLNIPVIVLTELHDAQDATKFIGYHACTVTGFSLPATEPSKGEHTKFASDRVDELYVHDDQVGPFARMEFDDANLNDAKLTTSYKHNGAETTANPYGILIPLYNKIRIPFNEVVRVVQIMDEAFTFLRVARPALEIPALEWDVRLSGNNDFKASIAADKALSAKARAYARCLPLPRFMWRATAKSGSVVIFDTLFDATDIADGRLLCYVNARQKELREELASLATMRLADIKDLTLKDAKERLAKIAARFPRAEEGLVAHFDEQG